MRTVEQERHIQLRRKEGNELNNKIKELQDEERRRLIELGLLCAQYPLCK